MTAIDINPLAVECTIRNARINGLPVEAHVSDLFQAVSLRFNLIAVNPPYYRKPANNMAERAWNAGPELEYFKSFFSTLGKVIQPGTEVLMILSEDCDMKEISGIASANKYALRPLEKFRKMGETLTIWKLNHS